MRRLTLFVALALLAVTAAAHASSVLLVGERDATLEDMLVRAGFTVCTGCGFYDVVIVNGDASIDASDLEQFIARGGNVALIGGAPYYLAGGQDLSSIEDWFGAWWYTNEPRCTYATAALDRPFGSCLNLGDIVAWSSCSWDGAAAIMSLEASASVVASWNSGRTFAFVHEYGRGRVYYQSQLGYGPCARDMFVDAVRWLAWQR